MTKKNVIAQDPIGDGVGARKLKVRFSLSRTGHVISVFGYTDKIIKIDINYYLFIYLFMHACVYLFIYHLFIYLFTYLFIHSFIL